MKKLSFSLVLSFIIVFPSHLKQNHYFFSGTNTAITLLIRQLVRHVSDKKITPPQHPSKIPSGPSPLPAPPPAPLPIQGRQPPPQAPLRHLWAGDATWSCCLGHSLGRQEQLLHYSLRGVAGPGSRGTQEKARRWTIMKACGNKSVAMKSFIDKRNSDMISRTIQRFYQI